MPSDSPLWRCQPRPEILAFQFEIFSVTKKKKFFHIYIHPIYGISNNHGGAGMRRLARAGRHAIAYWSKNEFFFYIVRSWASQARESGKSGHLGYLKEYIKKKEKKQSCLSICIYIYIYIIFFKKNISESKKKRKK